MLISTNYKPLSDSNVPNVNCAMSQISFKRSWKTYNLTLIFRKISTIARGSSMLLNFVQFNWYFSNQLHTIAHVHKSFDFPLKQIESQRCLRTKHHTQPNYMQNRNWRKCHDSNKRNTWFYERFLSFCNLKYFNLFSAKTIMICWKCGKLLEFFAQNSIKK